jgi:RNA polymerase sigma-70 factor (ECF subfamily)
MTQAEELELIRRAMAGERSAAETLVRAYQQPLYAFLLRVSGRADVAEDATQEALVRALVHLEQFDGRHRFSTWLYTIAKRVMLNQLQKRTPALVGEAALDRDNPASAVGPAELAGKIEDGDRVQHALRRALLCLSPEQREILVLFHQLSWPIVLIARHLEMPEGTIKSHLHRGRQRLREILESEGFGAGTGPTPVTVTTTGLGTRSVRSGAAG